MKKLTELQKESRRALKMQRKADAAVGKLKRTIMYLDIGHLSYDQWVTYRKNYIGGSDVATILTDEKGRNLNPWQSKLEVFHEKVGVISKTGVESEATYAGHVLEEHIKNHYWVYHDMDDPTPEALLSNATAGNKLRYARNIKDKMMYDPKIPHLKINIDGFIQNTRFEKAPRGLLEVKSGLGRVWNMYEAGIPVFYIIQVQTYLLVTGLKYAEIAVLLDGRFFKCFPIEANKDIQDKIVQETTDFWQLVMDGRDIWDDPTLTESEKYQFLSEIEPDVDGGNAVDKYLKERFRSDYKVGSILIDKETADLGELYLDTHEALKGIEDIKREHGSRIRKIFLDNQVDEIVDVDGKVIISHRRSSPDRSPILKVNKSVRDLGL